MKLTAAPAGADGHRRTAATDAITVPAGRRAARVSAGLWAGIVLAAFALVTGHCQLALEIGSFLCT